MSSNAEFWDYLAGLGDASLGRPKPKEPGVGDELLKLADDVAGLVMSYDQSRATLKTLNRRLDPENYYFLKSEIKEDYKRLCGAAQVYLDYRDRLRAENGPGG